MQATPLGGSYKLYHPAFFCIADLEATAKGLLA